MYNKADSMLHTFAINRENGAIIWADSVAPDTLFHTHPVNSYTNPTVVSNGKRVFSHFPCYGLIAYELDGIKSWEYRHSPTTHRLRGGGSPVIRDSVVIFNVSIWPNPRIQAQDCETGDSLWVLQDTVHYYTLDVTNASPVFHGDLLIMHQYRNIVGYNMKNRNVEWWLEIPTTAVSTPVVDNDVVYIGTWTNFGEERVRGMKYSFEELISAFDLDHNQKLDQEEIPDSLMVYQRSESKDLPNTSMRVNEDRMFRWYDESGDGAFDSVEWTAIMEIVKPYLVDHGMLAMPVTDSGDLTDSILLWKITDNTPETPSPLIVGENEFFIKSGGIVTAINRESGNVVKNGRIGAAGAYLSSPMLARNRIYTCSFNGTVTVLSAEDFNVLTHNKLKEKIGASPVAVDDVLYIRTDKNLFAFR